MQMDPIGAVDINADSSFRIAFEAQERGHSLFHYLPEGLSCHGNEAVARGWDLSVRWQVGDHFELGPESTRSLSEFDVIWLRQDPPFDMSYITTTHILEMIAPSVLVVNNPFWVRNLPEKIFALKFPDLIPPTIISRDVSALRQFREEQGHIVMKPLFGNGGTGVFYLAPGDRNFNALCEMFLESSREPVIAQLYLDQVRQGDKRIILIDGKPVGAINRVPAPNESRSNLHVGGRAEKSNITEREMEICNAIGPELARNGQLFVGIDVIGGLLTEINVTSPTGIVELERFDGVNAAGLMWNAIEKKCAGLAFLLDSQRGIAEFSWVNRRFIGTIDFFPIL